MRTYTEYEPEDIDLKDPINGFILSQLLVAGLVGFKPREGEDLKDPKIADLVLKRQIALFLNDASRQGISLVKNEVPAPFKNAFPGLGDSIV